MVLYRTVFLELSCTTFPASVCTDPPPGLEDRSASAGSSDCWVDPNRVAHFDSISAVPASSAMPVATAAYKRAREWR